MHFKVVSSDLGTALDVLEKLSLAYPKLEAQKMGRRVGSRRPKVLTWL
jgi:hypothetical protein